MKVRTTIWSAMLLLILVVSLPVMAQEASDASTKPEAQKSNSGNTEVPDTLVPNTGGSVLRVYAITENSAKQRTEGAYLLVPGASITVNVPANSSDLITATFSGECRLFGTTGKNDWLQISIRDNGVPIEPIIDNADPVAFCSDDNWSSHSIQAVKRLEPGTHKIQVFWKLVDFDTNDVLKGWLDDYSLVILQSN